MKLLNLVLWCNWMHNRLKPCWTGFESWGDHKYGSVSESSRCRVATPVMQVRVLSGPPICRVSVKGLARQLVTLELRVRIPYMVQERMVVMCQDWKGVPGYAFDCVTGCLIGGHPANRNSHGWSDRLAKSDAARRSEIVSDGNDSPSTN